MKIFTSFCQVLKETNRKENWFLFFCLTVYIRRTDKQADGETPDRRFTLAAVMNAASAKCTL